MSGRAFNFEAFLDGVTGAGLFRRLRLPGGPSHFIAPGHAAILSAATSLDRSGTPDQEQKLALLHARIREAQQEIDKIEASGGRMVRADEMGSVGRA